MYNSICLLLTIYIIFTIYLSRDVVCVLCTFTMMIKAYTACTVHKKNPELVVFMGDLALAGAPRTTLQLKPNQSECVCVFDISQNPPPQLRFPPVSTRLSLPFNFSALYVY